MARTKADAQKALDAMLSESSSSEDMRKTTPVKSVKKSATPVKKGKKSATPVKKGKFSYSSSSSTDDVKRGKKSATPVKRGKKDSFSYSSSSSADDVKRGKKSAPPFKKGKFSYSNTKSKRRGESSTEESSYDEEITKRRSTKPTSVFVETANSEAIISLVKNIRKLTDPTEKYQQIAELSILIANHSYKLEYVIDKMSKDFYLNKKTINKLFRLFAAAQEGKDFTEYMADYKVDLFDTGKGKITGLKVVESLQYDNSRNIKVAMKVETQLRSFIGNTQPLKEIDIDAMMNTVKADTYTVHYISDGNSKITNLNANTIELVKSHIKSDGKGLPPAIKDIFYPGEGVVVDKVYRTKRVITKTKKPVNKKSQKPEMKLPRYVAKPEDNKKSAFQVAAKTQAATKTRDVKVEVYLPSSSGFTETYELITRRGKVNLTISFENDS